MKKEMIKKTIVKEEIMSIHMTHNRWKAIKRKMKMMEILILYQVTLMMIQMTMMKIKRMGMGMRMRLRMRRIIIKSSWILIE